MVVAMLVPYLAIAAEIIIVTGQHVNLRAGPGEHAEILSKASGGDTLTVRSHAEKWVEVDPPQGTFFWMYRESVREGTVAGATANMRIGPGIDYPIIARMAQGDPVGVIDREGDWLRVRSPDDLTLWISVDFVKAAPAVVAKGPHVVKEREPVVLHDIESVPAAATSRRRSSAISGRQGNLQGDGPPVRYDGVIQPASLVFNQPSAYRLVRTENNRRVTACYVIGDSQRLACLVGQSVSVVGREYTAPGVRHHVVVATGIVVADL